MSVISHDFPQTPATLALQLREVAPNRWVFAVAVQPTRHGMFVPIALIVSSYPITLQTGVVEQC